MRSIWIGICVLITTSHLVLAQKLELPETSEQLGEVLRTYLNELKNEEAAAAGEAFFQIWSSDMGPDHYQKVYQTVQVMQEKQFRTRPHLVTYLNTISYAVNEEGIDAVKLNNYLTMAGKVIENETARDALIFLQRMQDFFLERALQHSRYKQIIVEEDSYDFEYVENVPPPLPDERLELPVEDETEEEPEEESDEIGEDYFEGWDEEESDDDEWGTDWGDDDWGDSDWGGESESVDEPEEDPAELVAALIPEVTQPEPDGAIIKFHKLNLVFNAHDTVMVKNTAGSFMPSSGLFVGEGGTFDWSMADLPPDSVYVDLEGYNFQVGEHRLEADNAKLTYKGKLDVPVEGYFEFRSKKYFPNEPPTYPRFISYSNRVDVKNLGDKFLSYRGGFSLRGAQILSSAVAPGLSRLRMDNESGPLFKAQSDIFVFEDSMVYSKRAAVVLYHDYDSIYHPALQVAYHIDSSQLLLQKDKGGFKRTPYFSSFFNIEMVTDVIRWDLRSDSLDISTLNARSRIPTYFESSEYFKKENIARLRSLYDFNPLQMVIGYAGERNTREFALVDLVDDRKIDYQTGHSAIKMLMQAGFVDYNIMDGTVTLKDKSIHYIRSRKNKKDFDNLAIWSLTDKEPNATIRFPEKEMQIRGVERFYISEILDVYIEPDSGEITLLGNRDFIFDGSLYAGNFEYVGKEFTFRYDSFLVNLNQIEEINFYVLDENSRGSKRRKVDNSLSGMASGEESDSTQAEASNTSGTLFINKPRNKSARKMYPDYPKFDGSGAGSVVYFDKPEYLDGAYDRSFYFVIPPFKLDSLSDSDPAAIGFNGTFNTGGMFPEFKENLHIMPDFSLGFEHSIPPEGYELFGQDGRIYNKLTFDKDGLRGFGDLDFLTTRINANDIIFYPDSVTTIGNYFDVRQEEYGGVVYPEIHGDNFKLRWLPKKDSMYLISQSTPLELYQNTATLEGSAIVTRKGVNGIGTVLTRGSVSVSNQFTFESDRYRARHASFEIQSDQAGKPALAGEDVRLNFLLSENHATISPEIQGEAALEFPFAQFRTSIPTADWDLSTGMVTMSKPEEVNIKDSYFYTTREDLDSLSFSATEAEYNMQTLDLKVSGIPYIIVADSKITPENGEVLIHENSRIGTLTNTTLVIDTLNEYHHLYDGEITIISRNEFEGEATYEFVNSVEDTFGIRLTDFRLEDFSERQRKQEFHTVADGTISSDDDLLVSPGMFYKGNIRMVANKPALELDGFVKLDLKKIQNYDTWIAYQSEAEQQEVIFNFDEALTEAGQKLTAGLHFDGINNQLYSTFVYDKRDIMDEDFFVPSGFLRYKPDSNEYVIQDRDKEIGTTYAGKSFTYNENNGNISMEGPISFLAGDKARSIQAAGTATGNINSSEFSFNLFMLFTFDLPTTVYAIMAEDLLETIDELGAPEGLGDRTALLYKIANVAGDKTAKNYEKLSAVDYTPVPNVSPDLVRPLVFSNVDLKWSDDQKAFFSEGKIGLSNILRTDLNAAFDGFIEIRKTFEGETVDVFIKAAPDSWYYLSYENNKLIVFSSSQDFNKLITAKSNAGKAKAGEFVFVPGDMTDTLEFINRFRKVYYNIDEPYDILSPVEEVVSEEKEEKDDEDEGF